MNTRSDCTPSPIPEPDSPAATVRSRRVDSRDLFAEAGVVLIAHGGETYSLRLTRLGKLILTK